MDGAEIVRALKENGVTHIVWIPDTALGRWETAFRDADDLSLIRVCREGEAFGVAAGLILGGKKPIVMIQCTGLFEAGDALRNIVHDLKLPLFFVVGVRSYFAHQQKSTQDSCPVFTGPIMDAWQIPYAIFQKKNTPSELAAEYRRSQDEQQARAVLLAE